MARRVLQRSLELDAGRLMPDYDYLCDDCGELVERYFAMGRAKDHIPCRVCGGQMQRVYEMPWVKWQLMDMAKYRRIKAGEPRE